MKKFFLFFFILIILPLLIAGSLLFFHPLLIINPKNLAWLLHRTKALDEWSWKEARFSHERKGLLHRNFEGEFRDFCFKTNKASFKINACIEKLAWDFDFLYERGLKVKTLSPVELSSSFLELTPLKKTTDVKTDSSLPDIYKNWKRLWSSYIPDLNLSFNKIILILEERTFETDLSIFKTKDALTLKAHEFTLNADPEKIVLMAPQKYPFPKDLGATRPIYFRDFSLVANINKKGIPLALEGYIENISVKVISFIGLPLKHGFSSVEFRKSTLKGTSGEVKLTGLKESLLHYAPPPYNKLPAPLNIMDGDIIFNLSTSEAAHHSVLFNGDLNINLKSKDQVVDVSLLGKIPFDVMTFKRGKTEININFQKLALKLPRLSKKVMPPQFKPDGRFKKSKEIGIAKKRRGPPLSTEITATGENALHLKSNLLDEPLRLNLDLLIKDSAIKDGYVKILPLKTTVFKRPIHVQETSIVFSPRFDPVIESTIVFPLPEYKVTMNLEGPLSKPRYAFSSKPPLPESDIYAVLLFGRPMDDLAPEDRTNASRTNQVLSQGLLSLSTLYFLAGSPVEYVGYDPESGVATAQIGLGKKSSLRVGGGQEGLNSTAIRRSLGKGWYLDTSVQDTKMGTQANQTQNFGVMLERIISY